MGVFDGWECGKRDGESISRQISNSWLSLNTGVHHAGNTRDTFGSRQWSVLSTGVALMNFSWLQLLCTAVSPLLELPHMLPIVPLVSAKG